MLHMGYSIMCFINSSSLHAATHRAKPGDDSAVLFNSIYPCQILPFIHSLDLSSCANYTNVCIFIAKNNGEWFRFILSSRVTGWSEHAANCLTCRLLRTQIHAHQFVFKRKTLSSEQTNCCSNSLLSALARKTGFREIQLLRRGISKYCYETTEAKTGATS